MHGSLFFMPKRLHFLLKKGIMDAEESKKRRPHRTQTRNDPNNGKEHRFMKNWKKLLACLLVGLMALTVFTACDASVGKPMGPERSKAESESVKKLCESFKGVTYDEELSEKAYYIAYWVAGTSLSCKVNPEKTELSRRNSVDNVAKTYLNQGYYASAFDSMGIGKGIGGGMGKDDFTPGFDIQPDPNSPDFNSTSDITFVLPKDGTYPKAMTKAAEGKTKLGVAYVVKDGVKYAVVLFG